MKNYSKILSLFFVLAIVLVGKTSFALTPEDQSQMEPISALQLEATTSSVSDILQNNEDQLTLKEKFLVKKVVKKVNKNLKKIQAEQPLEQNGVPKSQLVALILAIVFGGLGVHRFYLGYTGIGVLMLLTGGVCGILALIDIIRIITGSLKPADGSDYDPKF